MCGVCKGLKVSVKSEIEKRGEREKEFQVQETIQKAVFLFFASLARSFSPLLATVSHSFVPRTKQQPYSYFELSGESSYCVFHNFPSTTVGLDAVDGFISAAISSRYMFRRRYFSK